MSVNSKMTAIADEIRELSGTTGTMGLDAMASTLNAENTNFASNLTTQDNLISQIQTALQNKAAATGEDVTSETTAYTNKLATLETAITALATELQGKASGGSGGGSVETCNVQLSTSVGFFNYIVYSHVDSNGVVSTYETTTSNSINLTNVVCGTSIQLGTSSAVGVETKAGVEALGSGVFTWHITANAGETAVLSFYNPF